MLGTALAQFMGSLLAELLGRDPGPIGRMNKAYRASFDEACDAGRWDDDVLVVRLRDLTVPGAYTAYANSLSEKALEGWRRIGGEATLRVGRPFSAPSV